MQTVKLTYVLSKGMDTVFLWLTSTLYLLFCYSSACVLIVHSLAKESLFVYIIVDIENGIWGTMTASEKYGLYELLYEADNFISQTAV